MARLLPLLALPVALGLWSVLLWWGLPFGVSLRLEPRSVSQQTPTGGGGVWRLEVTATYPQLTGLALGDRVQFDRYGVLPATRGSVQCLPATRAVQVTPLGGRIDHAGHLDITRHAVSPADCPAPSGGEPVVSVHP